MEHGNSRNGYHKVKCQVPETEELQEGKRWREKINDKTAELLQQVIYEIENSTSKHLERKL